MTKEAIREYALSPEFDDVGIASAADYPKLAVAEASEVCK
jgi:hypothetical protein